MRTFRGVKNFGAAKNQPAQPAAEQTNMVSEPSTEPEALPDKQHEAICFLLSGNTMQATADFCGINARTLRRWMHTEAFNEEYGRQQQRCIKALEAQVLASTAKAIAVLNSHLASKDEQVHVRAAKAIAQINHKMVISMQIKNRLDNLEKNHSPANIPN